MFLFLSVSFPLLMERCLLSMDIRICLAPKSHHFQQQGDVGCPQNQLQRDNNGRVMGSQKLYFDHVLITALGMKLSACHTLLTDSSTSRLIRESIRKENMFQSPLH
jgi:hypothetical protein